MTWGKFLNFRLISGDIIFYIQNEGVSRHETLLLFFFFNFVYNTSKDQVYSISGSEFYEWLFETFEKRGPWFDSGLVKSLPHVCAYFRICKFFFVDSKISL